MQPSMSKVRSLDYSSSVVGVAGGRKHTPLMHSVSIVVELAHDVEPLVGSASGPSMDTWRALEPALDEAAKGEPDAAEDDDEEEEEEEEEDEDECLAGGLARRVVVVDEADKIQRVRARSAEPEVSLATCSEARAVPLVGGSVAGQISGGGTGPRDVVADSRWCGSSGGPTRKQSSGACELAEHGELSQLGMRRNTCHQLTSSGAHQLQADADWPAAPQVSPGQPQQQAQRPLDADRGPKPAVVRQRHARSGSAQLESTANLLRHVAAPTNQSSVEGLTEAALGVAGVGGLASGSSSQCPLRNRCHQQQRRRSLQISFLSGSGKPCAGNQLLTEEELRGERQFNEHLRSLRSSADWTLASQQWSSLCGQHQRLGSVDQPQQQRCKSVEIQSSLAPRDSPEQEGPHTHSAWLEAAAQHKPSDKPVSSSSTTTEGLQRRRHSPRRVSFCSGEPLENHNPLALHKQLPDCTLKRHSVVAASGSDSDRCVRAARWPESVPPASGTQLNEEEEEELPETSSPPAVAAPMEPNREEAALPGADSQARRHKCSVEQSKEASSSRRKEEAGSGARATTGSESSRLQSIMANARQRQEEFARLLEEHEQIVNEINRVETKISNSQQASTGPEAEPVPVPVVAAASPVGGGSQVGAAELQPYSSGGRSFH